MSDFNYKITERIAVLSQSANGEKTLELNRISYNGRAAVRSFCEVVGLIALAAILIG